jgi:uncharacterized membrane protein YedE/YeeE
MVLFVFEKLNITARKPRPNATVGWFSSYDANIIGGLLLGVAMALTGACPGTVVVQLGLGLRSGAFVAAGGVLGGIFYPRYKALLKNTRQPQQPVIAETIASKCHLSPNKVLLAFEAACISVVTAATIMKPGSGDDVLNPVVGGLLIGGAQAASLLLTGSTIGVSTAYEQIGEYFWTAFGYKDVSAPPAPPSAIIFALGILGASASLSRYSQFTIDAHPAAVSDLTATIGGFLMILGSRIAGGCTSGHGISGLSSLSFSSLITVTAMFIGGIAAAAIFQ